MLKIQWEFSAGPGSGRVGEFSLGDLSVEGARGRATSRDRTPRQSMMVFPTIVNMLDGVRTFLEGRAPRYALAAVGSSFSFTLTRARDGRFVVAAGGVEIDTVPQADLVRAVWDGAEELLAAHRDAAGSNAADLSDAEEQFRQAFRL